jgi:hypothetical protein
VIGASRGLGLGTKKGEKMQSLKPTSVFLLSPLLSVHYQNDKLGHYQNDKLGHYQNDKLGHYQNDKLGHYQNDNTICSIVKMIILHMVYQNDQPTPIMFLKSTICTKRDILAYHFDNQPTIILIDQERR